VDIFALASLWEGLGRALTEAMAMRIPVAATNVNGVPELVIHRKTGLLSPPREPAQLAENIIWLLHHPAEARKMGERARERVIPAFSAESMVEQIQTLYESLLVEKEIYPSWLVNHYSNVS
jgi:glycosyltransferase involved in cell wall biosynthesis